MAINAAQSVSSVLGKVKGGMAYSNLYRILIPKGNFSALMEFRAKGSQLPSSEIGVMEVPYRGRKLKVPSQRSFSEWTCTVMETKSMELRAAFEEWIESIDGSATGSRDPAQTVDIQVKMDDGAGNDVIGFDLFGAFPSSIGQVELSFEEQTAPLEYSVTFQYSYHVINKGQSTTGQGTARG